MNWKLLKNKSVSLFSVQRTCPGHTSEFFLLGTINTAPTTMSTAANKHKRNSRRTDTDAPRKAPRTSNGEEADPAPAPAPAPAPVPVPVPAPVSNTGAQAGAGAGGSAPVAAPAPEPAAYKIWATLTQYGGSFELRSPGAIPVGRDGRLRSLLGESAWLVIFTDPADFNERFFGDWSNPDEFTEQLHKQLLAFARQGLDSKQAAHATVVFDGMDADVQSVRMDRCRGVETEAEAEAEASGEEEPASAQVDLSGIAAMFQDYRSGYSHDPGSVATMLWNLKGLWSDELLGSELVQSYSTLHLVFNHEDNVKPEEESGSGSGSGSGSESESGDEGGSDEEGGDRTGCATPICDPDQEEEWEWEEEEEEEKKKEGGEE